MSKIRILRFVAALAIGVARLAAEFQIHDGDRVVFLGGEARDTGLCQSLASGLRLPAKVGDPMARFLTSGKAPMGLPDPQSPHPGWAVACGLASSPTDL